ncbi:MULTISPECIES: glyoxalase [unclassified Microbacterium]|uniref:glyoxalase n=1 Tax=unclassified Microbacterium TaxID=2609290 RepID=UPI001604C151|nr:MULTISPECIES: glyoxalase [unclassified Microbacterium]QNA92057.1 glyoxalase [Microbacterium sp. Se63.02b]QYM65290.1 glyoxalase [Microbacterium sp. Se5.02b]
MNTTITSLTLDVSDVDAARSFYAQAFDLGDRLRFRTADTDASGFRGYTLSLVVSQPANVRALVDAAAAAGARVIKPVAKSLWGVGGTIQAPDGSIWKVATSAKKDSAPPTRDVDEIVLLLGADDVVASKSFYMERGIPVGKSFGRSYVQFDTGTSPIGLGLYRHASLAKDAGVPAEGSGSHRITINGVLGAAVDPDGFVWAPVAVAA